jgi:hypothetical protein
MKKVLLTILMIFALAFSSSCQKTPDNTVSLCPPESLLVNQEVFTALDVDGPYDSPGARDNTLPVSRSYFYIDASTWQLVAPFTTIEEARGNYSSFSKNLFVENEYSGNWSKPNTTFKSNLVDEYVYACGYQNGGRVCIFSSRYKNYMVTFLMRMGDNKFDDNDFTSAIDDIDYRMRLCLSSAGQE